MIDSSTDLPDGWVWTTFGDTCQIVMGQSPPSSTYNNKGIGLPFFQGKAEFGDLYPTPVKWCSIPKKTAEPQDVLFSMRAPVGPTNLANEKCCIGRGLAALRPEIGMGERYFLYFLRLLEREWGEYTTGTTFEAISGDKLASRNIPLAPLNEQQRIVEAIESYFTRLDAAEAALRQAQTKLAQYRTALLKAACEGRLVPTEAELAAQDGRPYEAADKLLEKILAERKAKWEVDEWTRLVERAKQRAAKDARKSAGNPLKRSEKLPEAEWLTLPEADYKKYLPKNDHWKQKYQAPQPPDIDALPELPEGWCWATMPQLGELSRGKSTHRPRNDSHLYGGRYPFIQTSEVRAASGTISDYSQSYNEAGLAQSRLWPVGTLCITIAANIADTGILGFDACFPDSIVGFLAEDGSCNVKFVEFFLRTAKSALEKFAPATAQKNINLEILRIVAIPMPPIDEQNRIVVEMERLLSIINDTEESISDSNERQTKIRQAILLKAYSGKLVDQDPSDEPAQILLEKIEEERKIRSETEIAERKKHVKTKSGKEKDVNKQHERKSLLEILSKAESFLSPNELFDEAGYTLEFVDEFYEELRSLMPEKVIEQRAGTGSIGLKVVKNANSTA